MDSGTFKEVIGEQMQRCEDMLFQKNAAYNPNEDKLHIFKRTAMLRSTTPQGALSGMMAKHTGSVYDMCESGKEYPMEVWNEKISDHINYLLLLRAVVEEQSSEFKARLNSDEALEALRKKLTENVVPAEEIRKQFLPPVVGTPRVENYVDREIYITTPGDALIRNN